MSPDGNTAYLAEGGSGGWIGAFKPGGSEEPQWIGRVDGDVLGITATDQRVYVGGHFDAEVPNHNDDVPQADPHPLRRRPARTHRHLVAFDLNGKSDTELDGPGRHRRKGRPSCWPARRPSTSAAPSRTSCRSRSSTAARGSRIPGFAMFPAK